MANETITVLEADGVTQTDVKVLDFGRQAASASKSLTLSTEDKTVLDSLATKLDTCITALQIIDNMVLSAGTNNIGDVDVLTIGGQTPAFGAGASGATVQRFVMASDQLAAARTTAGAMVDTFQLIDVPTDGTAAQRPVAVAHGTNPTAVAAGAKVARAANRAGIPFMIGGHPNVITTTAKIADADGAQTNVALVTVSAGAKIVVTAISAICDADNTGKVAVRIGFAAATLPSASASGAAGMLLEGKYSANSGNQKGNGSGILGVGADGEDLRFTCDDPVGGALYITASYYTIES